LQVARDRLAGCSSWPLRFAVYSSGGNLNRAATEGARSIGPAYQVTPPKLQHFHFTSVAQLRHAIDEFIKNYNSDAAPFEWTKSQVHQVGVTKHINNLRN
jgi:hypothetical protein